MKRSDGTHLKNFPKFYVLEFYLMDGRNESVIYFNQQIDVSKTLAYLDKINIVDALQKFFWKQLCLFSPVCVK